MIFYSCHCDEDCFNLVKFGDIAQRAGLYFIIGSVGLVCLLWLNGFSGLFFSMLQGDLPPLPLLEKGFCSCHCGEDRFNLVKLVVIAQ